MICKLFIDSKLRGFLSPRTWTHKDEDLYDSGVYPSRRRKKRQEVS